MKIAVYGLWHLGSVTASCLAASGHHVVGLDPDPKTVTELGHGRPPLLEPGLAELTAAGLAAGTLTFTTAPGQAIPKAELVWVTFDTPVDEHDIADVDYVVQRTEEIFPHLQDGAVVVFSSQMPVGSTARVQRGFAERYPGRRVDFCCIPENLRLGKAIDCFMKPDRFVAGVPSPHARDVIGRALAPITDRVEWVSVPSAEMTKHAINSFLALSVVFANELAAICEQVGADGHEVARCLKSEQRIGKQAYVSPGSAFAGGTLARDVRFLEQLSARTGKQLPLLGAILPSNEAHKQWVVAKLAEIFGEVRGRTFAVLGLTYKANTSTLRRSSSVETCQALAQRGARIRAFDPGVEALPPELDFITLTASIDACLAGADAVIIQTPWDQFKSLAPAALAGLRQPVAIDPNGYLAASLAGKDRVAYYTIGKNASHVDR